MLALENADEILQILDRFTKQKSKDIPPELEEYINYVAKTGDTVYRWPTVQYLFREKLRNVIKDFHDTTASIDDLPQCPNVDQFNYESMKTLLFERFDNFQAAPFTVQRLCELLTDPKKHYSRLDKFMRALEKNILVVSTVEPGRKPIETDENEGNNILNRMFDHIEMEFNKSEEKRATNGTAEKHNECNANERTAEEVASSSGVAQISSEGDLKKEEKTNDVKDEATEKPAESESSVGAATETELPIPKEAETSKVEEKSTEANSEETVDTKAADIVKSEVAPAEELNETPVKVDATESVTAEPVSKAEDVGEVAKTPSEEKKDVAEEKEKIDVDVTTVEKPIEKPSTPKHARSTSDDDDSDDDGKTSANNPSAKKIRLEVGGKSEKSEEVASSEPSIEADIVADVELGEEAETLDSLSTEIDAEKEKELLEDAVDTAPLVESDSIKTDDTAVVDKVAEEVLKATDDLAVPADLLKTDEPVAIPADLDTDFTPDEALNELVSSEILAVIPEQAAEEVKMSEEPATTDAVAAADEMNVENPEINNQEVENAMEAAPIKADEEQMDVDESNSVDAMDL